MDLLVVEDNSADVAMLKASLEDHGVTARWAVAQSLAKAAEILENYEPSCILLDLALPDSEPSQTLVRTRDLAPDIPIVVLTGYADEQLGLRVLGEGAQDYLVKGTPGGDAIFRSIRYAIERNRSAVEARQNAEELASSRRQAVETKSLLDLLLTAAPIGFGFVDLDFRFQEVNEVLAAINGAPRQAHLGHTVAEIVPDLWPSIEPVYRQVLDQGASFVNVDIVGETLADPGNSHHWLVSFYPVVPHDKPIGIGIVVIDVTERDRADRRFQTVIEASVDPIFVAEVVRDNARTIVDLVIAYANPAGCELLALAPDRVVGGRVFELLPQFEAMIPDYREQIDEGKTRWNELHYEGTLGGRVDVSLTFDVGSAPLDDGFVVSVRDVSARAADREALRQSEARFRALIEHTNDLILVVDRAGNITFASPSTQRLLGRSEQELIGSPLLATTHPDDTAALAGQLAHATSTSTVTPAATFRVADGRGAWRWIESIAQAVLEDSAVDGVVVNARDVTTQRRNTSSLNRVNGILRTLTSADTAIVHSTGEESLLKRMSRLLVENGGYAEAWVVMAELSDRRDLKNARYSFEGPVNASIIEAVRQGPRGPIRDVLNGSRTQVVKDVASLPSDLPLRQVLLDIGFRSMAVLPLIGEGEVIGALVIHAAMPEALDAADMVLLEQLADDLAYGVSTHRTRIERQQYLERLRSNLDALVETIASTVEYRDPYTAGHQLRVAELAVAIAIELGIDDDAVNGIATAARIHDLGKIAIPAELLSKPTKLSAAEFSVIKEHAQIGYDILAPIEFPWPVPEMVRQHHERIDGSGYPRGLLGTEMLLGAQIIAVADVVEAMASHRPYRVGKGIDVALQEIEDGRGKIYNDEVVAACLRIFASGDFAWAL